MELTLVEYYLGPSYADLSFSSSYERQLDKRHGQILIHDASFRFMFLYVILISQTWLDLPAEQRLADRDLRMAGCCWLAANDDTQTGDGRRVGNEPAWSRLLLARA